MLLSEIILFLLYAMLNASMILLNISQIIIELHKLIDKKITFLLLLENLNKRY